MISCLHGLPLSGSPASYGLLYNAFVCVQPGFYTPIESDNMCKAIAAKPFCSLCASHSRTAVYIHRLRLLHSGCQRRKFIRILPIEIQRVLYMSFSVFLGTSYVENNRMFFFDSFPEIPDGHDILLLSEGFSCKKYSKQ